MIIDIILIIIGLAGLIFASITDLKTREVPDWLNFFLISIGFGLRLIYSLTYQEWFYFIYALIGFIIMFIIGNLMYYLKQWGGGDAKLLMALGVIFATAPKFLTPKLNSMPFLLILFINIMVAGAIYGLVYSIIIAIMNKRKFLREAKIIYDKYRTKRMISISLALPLLIASFLMKTTYLRLTILILSILIFSYVYVYIFIRSVENSCMLKVIPIEKLTPGDWVLSQKLINKFKISNLGIEEYQIAQIKKSRIKKVLIKEGLPFVPSFLLGTLISLVLGNLLHLLF